MRHKTILFLAMILANGIVLAGDFLPPDSSTSTTTTLPQWSSLISGSWRLSEKVSDLENQRLEGKDKKGTALNLVKTKDSFL